jgi:hypothetical protein
VTFIDDIKTKQAAFEKKKWNIAFPSSSGKRVFNVKPVVYKVMEAALEFKDIVDGVLEFDVTKYGALAWSVVSFSLNVSPVISKYESLERWLLTWA